MITSARLVLADCEDAARDLVESEIGPMWRRRWVACLALLRSVGHVLDKVDSNSDPSLSRIIRDRYLRLKASRPKPEIFWRFIDDERNIVLKQYEFRVESAALGVGVSHISKTGQDGRLITAQANWFHEVRIDVMRSGPFEGRREIEVVQEAIEWWRCYLDEIELEWRAQAGPPAS